MFGIRLPKIKSVAWGAVDISGSAIDALMAQHLQVWGSGFWLVGGHQMIATNINGHRWNCRFTSVANLLVLSRVDGDDLVFLYLSTDKFDRSFMEWGDRGVFVTYKGNPLAGDLSGAATLVRNLAAIEYKALNAAMTFIFNARAVSP